ncbi:hypothetical protein ACTXT7_006461 [Hymenolepis weldensis]
MRRHTLVIHRLLCFPLISVPQLSYPLESSLCSRDYLSNDSAEKLLQTILAYLEYFREKLMHWNERPPTLTPGCVRPPVEKPSLQLLAIQAADHFTNIRAYINICRLPKDTGPCKGGHARYYYDPSTSKCRLFMYGGCLGNGNRFTTKTECEEACGALSQVYETGAPVVKVDDTSTVQVQKTPQVPVEVFEEMRRITVMYSERYPWDFCLQHHTYGTCPRPRRIHDGSSENGVHLTRFFYNRKTKHCEPYFYTGCGARGNHFETKSQCDNVCARRLRRSVSQICDASHIEECHGSGLRLWIYEADAGTCRQIEVCPPNITDSFQPQLGGIGDVFSLWPSLGGGGGVNGHLLPGTFASSSACYNHCLPPTPSGTDVTSK